MERRRLGGSDLEVSVVGLGCNNFGGRIDFERTRAVVEAALDAGVTFFDTADVYGNRGDSERFLGELLQGRRDRVVLATKFGWDMGADGSSLLGSAEYVHRAIDASLERLRTDRVDLYYYHRPDGVTPLAETLGAMHELVEEGKVRAIGCSNLSAEQLREVVEISASTGIAPVVALQNEYSLLEREAEEELLPLCREHAIGFVPYFPLASGVLTGKYRPGEPAPPGTRFAGRDDRLAEVRFDAVDSLARFAEARGRSLLELALGALVSTPGIASVIAGATSPEQVRANVAAGEWRLSEEELAELGAVAPPAAA